MCSECLDGELEWIDASGRGEVFSYVIMHQIYHTSFAKRVPYAVAEIKLDEGPHVISNIIDCPPHEVHIDMPVEVTFEKLGDTIALPLFRPRRS